MWKNRIVGYDTKPANQFTANPLNFRRHPALQREALRGLLGEVGWVGAVLENTTTGNLIDGHARIEEALSKGEETPIPYLKVELTEAEEKLVLASYDPISALATTDKEVLETLLQQTKSSSDAVDKMLADLAKQNGVNLGGEVKDVEPEIDRAAELLKKWKVERGQVWEVGKHRLMCGDSTDAGDVTVLMAGSVAELAPADPPYNVGFEYDGETVDDRKSEDVYEQFSRKWFTATRDVSQRQIVTPGCNNLGRWCRYFDPFHVAPWTKTNSMTNGKVARWWCWEPIMFFGAQWARVRSNDVFDYPIGQQKEVADHPCPKPLPLWHNLIENYSSEGALLYEPFCGSGTTMVAAEQLGRVCYAMEISAAYCAVTLERMSKLGLTPKLAEEANGKAA